MSVEDDVDALSEAPVLAGMSAEARRRLASRLRTVEVSAGDWLFRAGDAADSAYFVRSGRFELVDEAADVPVFGELRRGAVLGELALLRHEARSASVRARRDGEALELRREDFDELLRAEPEFAIGLTRSLAAQLGATRPATPRNAPFVSVAVIALDPAAPAALVADRLAAGLARYGAVARLGEEEGALPRGEFLAALSVAERDHERVVLAGGGCSPHDPWVDRRLREADLVVAVATCAPGPEWEPRLAGLRECELLVAGRALGDEQLETLAPRHVSVRATADGLLPAVDALARRLSGRSPGLVLSGGGARALAHLGVFEELYNAGVRFDRVAGASLGSLVAGAIAMGWSPDEAHAVFAQSFRENNPTTDYTIPMAAFLRGAKTRSMLAEVAGDIRIEEMPKSFFCVSCDMVARGTVVHRTGLAREALYASLAIPGVFPPLRTADGRILVDGGVLDNLPAETMARDGEGPVVASDVSARDGRWAAKRRTLSGPLAQVRRALTGSETPLPTLGETLLRTFMLGSTDTSAQAKRHAALVVLPEVEGIGLMDWKQLDRAREAGRRAAHATLETADPALLGL
jgi:predicted acylesterase/phospholipase RssA/CRP-like cAMP-binding protein